MTVDELEAALIPYGEIQGGWVTLALPPDRQRVMESNGSLYVVMQLIVFDEQAGERSVRDIKEQEVQFVPAVYRLESERVLAYVAGWAAALAELLPKVAAERVVGFLPDDFVDSSVLGLARAETADQFRAALLRKGRLGKLAG